MRIELKNGGFVEVDNCAFFEVYSIDVDKDSKTLELNDEWGYVRGTVNYEECEEIQYINYEGEEELNPYPTPIIKNGELII